MDDTNGILEIRGNDDLLGPLMNGCMLDNPGNGCKFSSSDRLRSLYMLDSYSQIGGSHGFRSKLDYGPCSPPSFTLKRCISGSIGIEKE